MNARTEPIAAVGIGRRFPGAENPDEFRELLREGRDVEVRNRLGSAIKKPLRRTLVGQSVRRLKPARRMNPAPLCNAARYLGEEL